MTLRDLTKQESDEIINSLIPEEDLEVLGLKLYKKHKIKPNTYMFVVQILSLDLLVGIMEHELVKNVYFHADAPPPTPSMRVSPTASRYKIYVEYHQIEE